MLAHPKDSTLFVPLDQVGRPEPEQIGYYLKTPRLYDRVRLDRALAARGARRLGLLDVLYVLREGVERALRPEDPGIADTAREAIDLYEGKVREYAQKIRAADPEDVEGRVELMAASAGMVEAGLAIRPLEDAIADLYPPYAAARGDVQVYQTIRGIECTRMFLTGWKGRPEAFRREVQGVPEDLLQLLPVGHIQEIGEQVDRLFRPTEQARKN